MNASRSESPSTNNHNRPTNLRVRFKHPIEEHSNHSNTNNNSIHRLGKIDPMIHLHAKEIIAAKLMEGYVLTEGPADQTSCRVCNMPLMTKDMSWDTGMCCGSAPSLFATGNTNRGVCVVCPRHANDEELSQYDDDSSLFDRHPLDLDDLDNTKKRYHRHFIPSFPEEEEEEEDDHRWQLFDEYEEDELYSRDESHDVGSVGEFKKKFALKDSNRITEGTAVKRIEKESEVDEMCAKELKNTEQALISAGMTMTECKACPECGMEMLSFGETLECPFCALEVIKEELGIAGMQLEHEVDTAKVKVKKEEVVQERQKHLPKEKNEHGTIRSIDVGDLLAVSSSFSTLSASFMQYITHDKEQTPQEVPAENDKVAINTVLNELRDTQIAEGRSSLVQPGLEETAVSESPPPEENAVSPAPENTPTANSSNSKGTPSCNEEEDDQHTMPEVSLDENNAQDGIPDVGLTPMPEETQQPSVTGSTQTPVNTVLKKLITGFWMENKERTTAQNNDEIEEEDEGNDDTSLPSVFDEQAEEEDGEHAVDVEMERLINQTLNEELFQGVKSINDDLQARVKSFAASVFGTKKQGADDDDVIKSMEINVTSAQEKDDKDVSDSSNERMLSKTEGHWQQQVDQDGQSNIIPQTEENNARLDDFSPIENGIFHDDMSAEEIFATLNEIEAVTKNILDLPVFHENQDNQTMSREDEETTSPQEANCRASTIDPPSVCSRDNFSRDSREDPPMNKNGDIIRSAGNELLAPQKENVAVRSPKNEDIPEPQHGDLSMSAPDSRDPPTTFPRKYQPRSKANNPDIILPSAIPHLPRDPSEYGGSSELDSFSKEEDSNNLQHYQLGSNRQDIMDRVKQHIILNQDMSPQNKFARAEPAEPVCANDRFQKMNSTNVCLKPLITKYLKQSHDSVADYKSQRPDPMESDLRVLSITESESITLSPQVNKVTPIRAKDLYQRPDVLTKTDKESESTREAMVRNRLLQLNSRCQELASTNATSPSQHISSADQSQSNTQPVIREQRFTFDCVDLQHQTNSVSTTPTSTKESLSSLSPAAAARRQHYKKQLFAAEAEKKNRIQQQHSNDTGPCLSASALQRRKHYMEMLREKMQSERQSLQIVSQE